MKRDQKPPPSGGGVVTKRREFTRDTRAEVVRRAKVPTGFRCERCQGIVTKGEVHHKDQDAMQIDKRRKLTAADAEFLCIPCHSAETKAQAPVMAKVKRREAKALGVKTAPAKPLQSAPMPTTERAATRQPRPSLPPRAMFVDQ